MNIAVDAGLVFAIPLAEKKFGFGQLLAWQRPIFYMTAFDLTAESPHVSEDDMRRASPVFLGNFFDILIQNGRWPAIGKQEIPKVPFPYFRIKIKDKLYIEGWNREQIREVTPHECETLQFRSNHSAIVLENALKAHFGLGVWQPKYEALKVESVRKVSETFLRC